MGNPDATARQLGRDSLGLVDVRSLVEAGVAHSTIRRKVQRGDWERASAKVVDVSLQRWTWERRVLAAVLTGPVGSVASHATAAALHDLPGYPRRGAIELLVPRTARNRDLPFTIHSTSVPAEVCTIGDVPTSGLVRTLHALAGAGDARGLSRGVRAVLRGQRRSVAQLLTPRLRHLPGRALLERTVQVEHGRLLHRVDSPLEEAWIDRLLDWSLPGFTTQQPVTIEGYRYRIDVAWTDRRVALEGDGEGFHGDLLSQDADGRRDERLGRDRWSVVRVGAVDLRPDRAERVRRRLVGLLEV